MGRKILVLLVMVLLILGFSGGIARGEETGEKNDNDSIPTEEITVTATRQETPLDQTGSSVTVITRRAIETSQKTLLRDLLVEIPGLSLINTGPEGQMVTASIRGANTAHTLVLIDGIPVNDPSNPGRIFDFGALSTDDVEKIEVVRGPQSTVYGSDSMGGVINIITREGKMSDKPQFKFSGGAETGGYDSSRFDLNIQGGSKNTAFSAGASTSRAGKLSAAGEKYGNVEADPFVRTSAYGKLGVKASDRLRFDLLFRHSDNNTNLDTGSGPFADAVNYFSHEKSDLVKASAGYDILEEKWNSRLEFSHYSLDRKVHNNPFNPPDFTESYQGKTNTLGWHNKIEMGDHNILAGLISQDEQAVFTDFDPVFFSPFVAPRQSAQTTSFYIQDNFDLNKKLFASVGLRNDSHSTAGSKTTYRVSANYHLDKQFRLKGSYGTGFKAPTLYQLYSSFGNRNLRSETSRGWDGGLEFRSRNKRNRLGVTYFHNQFDNLIDFDFFTSQFYNINNSTTRGWEVYASSRLDPRLLVNANYTSLTTRDGETGMELLRRPKSRLYLGARYELIPKKGTLHGEFVNVGNRQDLDFSSFPSQRITLPSYSLVNAAFTYKLSDNTSAYLRCNNIFNTQYEDVWGYSYRGASLSGGMRFNF